MRELSLNTAQKQVCIPPHTGWMELLDAVQRLITRRRLQPEHEELVNRRIREKFPEAGV